MVGAACYKRLDNQTAKPSAQLQMPEERASYSREGNNTMTRTLTARQTAELLGVTSTHTVKNWLEGGYFPGARKTQRGWRFPEDAVLNVQARLAELARKNREREFAPMDFGDDAPEPPLL